MPAAEFVTLREACGLTQAEAAAILGMTKSTIRAWEYGRLAVKKSAGDALKNLDDLIRARATGILLPVAGGEVSARVELTRYRSPDVYAAGQPGHAGAGLTMPTYHAMLLRVIDGLARLGVRYVVRWSDDAAKP